MVSQIVPYWTPYMRWSHGGGLTSPLGPTPSPGRHWSTSLFFLIVADHVSRFSASSHACSTNCMVRSFLSYGRCEPPISVKLKAFACTMPCRSMPPVHFLDRFLSTLPYVRLSDSDHGVNDGST